MNPRIPIVIALALAVGLSVGCASSQKVTADWDAEADFSAYKTFHFKTGMAFASDVGEVAVEEIVSRVLESKGLREAPVDGEADLRVVLYPKMQFAGRVDWYSVGYMPWWGSWGGGATLYQSRFTDIPVGSLMVDLVDESQDRLVWRGTAATTLKDNNIEKNVQRSYGVIERMFDGFPPPAAPEG
jgi:hypothetical protein